MLGQAVWGPKLSPAGDPTQGGLRRGGQHSAPQGPSVHVPFPAWRPAWRTETSTSGGQAGGQTGASSAQPGSPGSHQQGPRLQAEVLTGSWLSPVHRELVPGVLGGILCPLRAPWAVLRPRWGPCAHFHQHLTLRSGCCDVGVLLPVGTYVNTSRTFLGNFAFDLWLEILPF